VNAPIRARFRAQLAAFTLDVDLHLPGRGITAIFGPSGSGKSTLLRCIAGLQRAEGALHIGNTTWHDETHCTPAHKRAVGYVFQDASLFPHLSVRGNLEYGRRRVPAAERRIMLEQATHWLGLDNMLDRRPDTLSGGERQRVAIARALLTSPRLLLMDEPLAALDLQSREVILGYLERLHEHLPVPVIYVTHSPDEVARLADHLILLEAGRVRDSGEPAELLTALDGMAAQWGGAAMLQGQVLAHDETWHLTRIGNDQWRLAVPREDLPPGSMARVRIHASDVSLARKPHDDTSILNILPVTVEAWRDLNPAQVLVRLRLTDGQPLLARITRLSHHRLELHEGQAVYAQIKSVSLVRAQEA